MRAKNYNYKEIGLRIKAIRRERRLTQEELSERIGVGSQHISDIERGLTGMSVGILIDLCDELNADTNYILFGTSSQPSDDSFAKKLDGLSRSQIMYAEQILDLYVKGCKENPRKN